MKRRKQRTGRSEHIGLRLLAALALLALATPATAQTSYSPDVTVSLSGTVVTDEEVAEDDLAGSVGLADLGSLPAAAEVDAFTLDGSDRLFSLDITSQLPGGLVARPADVVRYDGATYTLAFDSAAAGVPDGANVDAVSADVSGLHLSFDTTVDLGGGVTAADEDLVLFLGAGFVTSFDGSAAGLDESLDLDAANLQADGSFVLSLDHAGTIGGVVFDDDTVLIYDGTIWAIAVDASDEDEGFAAADLVAVPEPAFGMTVAFCAMAILSARALRGRAGAGAVRGAVACSLLVSASVSQAADGVAEINQTCAVETGCFAGDAAGFPITIDASGSYRLTSNLTVPADTTGVSILAEDVTLDLNGFSVRGPTDCTPALCPGTTGTGILSSTAGTRVTNGTVRGFADGGLDLGEEAVVDRVEARANGRVGIAVGDRGRIQNSQATRGAGDGVRVGSYGAVLDTVSVGNLQVGAALGAATAIGDAVVSDNAGGDVTGGAPFGSTSCNGASCSTVCTDADLDGFFLDCLPIDCDDDADAAFPGGFEICDGLDNDCNGEVDEGGVCSLAIAACRLQFPTDTTIALGDTVTSFGRVSVPGLTDLTTGIDPLPGLVAESGFGDLGTDPTTHSSWQWTTGAANPVWDDVAAADPGVDEYQTDVTPTVRGSFDSAYRFSTNGGVEWAYCDGDADGSTDGFDEPGSVEVIELCTNLATPSLSCTVFGDACVPDDTTPFGDIAQCLPTTGTGTQGATCVTYAECSPGFSCVFDGFSNVCAQWCEPGVGGQCSTGSCFGFSTPLIISGTEWGVCF